MGRSARRREPANGSSFVRNTLIAAGEGVMRNQLAVGASTAFLVTFSFVSANALWYQPHFYNEAFFSTRSHSDRQAAPARAFGPVTDFPVLEWGFPHTILDRFAWSSYMRRNVLRDNPPDPPDRPQR